MKLAELAAAVKRHNEAQKVYPAQNNGTAAEIEAAESQIALRRLLVSNIDVLIPLIEAGIALGDAMNEHEISPDLQVDKETEALWAAIEAFRQQGTQ